MLQILDFLSANRHEQDCRPQRINRVGADRAVSSFFGEFSQEAVDWIPNLGKLWRNLSIEETFQGW